MAQADQEDEIVTVALDPNAWIRVTALISFALATLLILIYLLSNGGRNLFQRKATLRTYVHDGSGLEKKAIVELEGIEIGRVSSVELSHSNEPSRVVRVNLSLNRNFLSAIPVDSQTEVTADNLLGDKYLNIKKGRASESVKEGDELFARPETNEFNPADLIESLRTVLSDVSRILDAIDDPSTPVGQFVKGEAFYTQFLNTVAGMQKTVHELGNPRSPAGQALFGTELYDQFREPLLRFDERLAAIQRGEGALGHFYASPEQYEQIAAEVANFRKSVEAFRKNEYLSNDQKYRDSVEALRAMSATITRLSAGPAFENAHMYESLSGSSKSAENFLRDFRNNPKKYLRIKLF
jgi:phospholipid/cholesterol/gamma-HCH transport system substrate-binding protein